MNRRSSGILPIRALIVILILIATERGPSSAVAADPSVRATAARRVHPLLIRNEHNEMLEVVVNVEVDEPITLRAARFDLTGTDDLDDIESLQLFAAGRAPTFTTAEPFGAARPAATTVEFSGERRLEPGRNVFWLSGRLRPSADLSHRIGAVCRSIETTAGAVEPVDQTPGRTNRIGVALRRPNDDGVHTYRIPALTTTKAGTLLCVYDMRRRMGRDLQEDIDIGLSRSTDGGRTWESAKVIMDMGEYNGLPQAQNGCSDPGILVDLATGEIFCFAVWMNGKPGKHQWTGDGSEPGFEIGKSAQFLMVRSRDDGRTWSKPENLTRALKKPEWWLFAPSPQQGINLPDGTLVMPAQGRDETGKEFSTVMVSRDHGASWSVGTPAYSGGSECQAALLGDGSIMLNMRNERERFRAVAVTRDLGRTWQPHPTSRTTLIEPNCNGSLLRVDLPGEGPPSHVLLFANPHSQTARTHQTIQVSFDDGQTWPESHHRLLDEGRGAGYPSLTRVDADHVGIVYEGSRAHLVFEKLAIAELLKPDAPARDAGAGRDPLTSHDPGLHLFVDDRWIAEQAGIKRVINRARPLPEPVIWPDDPATEADCAWGNVIREPDGRFRLWYATMMMGHKGEGPHEIARAGVWGRGDDYGHHPRSPADGRDVESMLGRYAESTDGIRWTRPNLNRIEFRGSRSNNILLTGERAAQQTGGLLTNFDGYTVLRDDREPDPRRRYKMVAHWESVHCWDNHAISGSLGRSQDRIDAYWKARGEYITYSPDGLRWEQPLERVNLPSGGGDRLLVVPDHARGRWTAYVRAGGWAYPAFSHSTNLVDWSAPEPARQITPAGVRAPAVECMIPFDYGDQYLGLPCGMDKPRGVFTPMLASRHPGEEWAWVDNTEPFIPFGPPGSYHASGGVPLHNEPFVVGDELRIYFNAFSRNQDPPCRFGTRSIGVSTLRRDGFAGITPADPDRAATLVTQPVLITGPQLLLNVEQRGEGGTVEVALLGADHQPIAGRGFAESNPIRVDSVRHRATWRGDGDLSPFTGKTMRLRIRLRGQAILYALATPPAQASR